MNHSPYTVLVIAAVVLFLLLFILGMTGFFIFTKQGNPFKKLLKEFDKKMWMTFGLGLFFLSLYLGIVFLGSKIIDSYNVFLYFYAYTSESIYIGLSIFLTLSITVYLIRLFIKFAYRKKNRNF